MSSQSEPSSEWVVMAAGVRRRILADGEKLMLVTVTFEDGASVARHQHPHEQVTHVLSGRLQFTVGDEVREVAAGQSVLLHSNVPHQVTALEPSTLIDAFSPPREDFRAQ